MNRATLLALRRPTLVALSAFALGASALTVALQERDRLDGELAAVQRLITESRSRQTQLAEIADRIRDDAARYAALAAAGVVGPERRQRWSDALREIAAARRLDDFDFVFGTARPASAESADHPVLMATPLKLRLRVRHEPELLTALDAIAGSTSAAVVGHGCELRRVADAPPAALEARCEFDWLSIRPATGTAP